MFEGKTIGFIGAGNMGGAMIAGLVNSQLINPDCIIAADPHEARLRELAANFGIQTTPDNLTAAKSADILVISVKPQVIDSQLLDGSPAEHCDLIISIAAGISIEHLKRALHNPRVVRSMPNTPAMIGQGMTVWTATNEVDQQHRDLARVILGSFGQEVFVKDESFMDAATALSGTGPAYVFLFMEALIDAGVHLGFSRDVAEKLVLQTVRGSVEYAEVSGKHPAMLRNQVTSPGGTTAEALYHMEKGGFRTVIARGIWAAYQRSMGLGGGKKVSDSLGGRNPDEMENGR